MPSPRTDHNYLYMGQKIVRYVTVSQILLGNAEEEEKEKAVEKDKKEKGKEKGGGGGEEEEEEAEEQEQEQEEKQEEKELNDEEGKEEDKKKEKQEEDKHKEQKKEKEVEEKHKQQLQQQQQTTRCSNDLSRGSSPCHRHHAILLIVSGVLNDPLVIHRQHWDSALPWPLEAFLQTLSHTDSTINPLAFVQARSDQILSLPLSHYLSLFLSRLD